MTRLTITTARYSVLDVAFFDFAGICVVIERTHVHDLTLFIEHEEFWRPNCTIVFRNLLRFVEQIGERKLLLFGALGHRGQ